MSGQFRHIPVLFDEVMDGFAFLGDAPCRFIDGTLGRAGHASGLLERHAGMQLLGLDRDSEALRRSSEILKFAENRVILRHGVYSQMADAAAEAGWGDVDGILLDIGVSSPQIDDDSRGFSWRADGPLDMRMDQDSELTASRILNRRSEEELADIFFRYGEIRRSRALAAAVVERRTQDGPFETACDLVGVCDNVLGRAKRGELPRPTLVFQALRIAVNDELGELERGLEAAFSLLKKGGVLAVISFHSLEDRIVKEFMREKARGCVCPPELPLCVCGHSPELEILTRKPVTAGSAELAENRRAASAKLRMAKKL